MQLKGTIPGIDPALLKAADCPYCEKSLTVNNPSCILTHTSERLCPHGRPLHKWCDQCHG